MNYRMKKIPAVLLACSLVVSSFAQGAATKAAPAPTPAPATPAGLTLLMSAAVVTAPLSVNSGTLSQPETTELAGGGKAVFEFTIATAGDYVMHAVVNGPGEDSNSFFINVDGDPEDPLMIWDINVTSGFEERVVSWRGKGDADSDEFAPKRFKLAAGKHKLIIVGREPAQLKSISIRLAAN